MKILPLLYHNRRCW